MTETPRNRHSQRRRPEPQLHPGTYRNPLPQANSGSYGHALPGGDHWHRRQAQLQESSGHYPHPAAARVVPEHVPTRRPARRRRTGRIVVTAILLGGFAFTAGGIGGYAAASWLTPQFGPTPCVGSAKACIPDLEAASVISALKAQGHTCTKSADNRNCVLQIGLTQYAFTLQMVGGQVHTYSAQVSTVIDGAPSSEVARPSKSAMTYLEWSARLPYAHEPEFGAEIDSWLHRQVDTRARTVADVGGYRYEIDATAGNIVDLDVDAVILR
jgi:hypothetical protein